MAMMKISASFPPWDGLPCLGQERFWSIEWRFINVWFIPGLVGIDVTTRQIQNWEVYLSVARVGFLASDRPPITDLVEMPEKSLLADVVSNPSYVLHNLFLQHCQSIPPSTPDFITLLPH